MNTHNKIRVMHLINCFTLAGSEILAYNIIEKIDPEKFEIYICSITTKNLEIENKIEQRLTKKGVQVIRLVKNKKGERVKTILKLFKILKKNRIEILNTHCSTPDFYGKAAAFLAKVPNVYSTIYNTGGYIKLREKLFQNITTGYVAISKYIENAIRKDIGIPEHKIKLIYNGVKHINISKKDIRQKKLTELGIDNNKKIIISAGRIAKVKGHNYLIDAAKKVLANNNNVHFLIVGNDKFDLEWTDKLNKTIKLNGLENNITITGARKDLYELLISSDIFVYPSLKDGLPITVLEAMTSRLPVIASRVGSVSEIIKHDYSGILINPKKPEEISSSIIKLLENPLLAHELANKASNIAQSKFSIIETTRKYENMYLHGNLSQNKIIS